ncbi:N-6 DNA methylase [symbiont of Argiope bruennichi]|uniref:HsdM family class I SAM-dependent methyltransferase n=1 Tax=symbiont of Argiope bruennichi TaxID=2810479 RepID=UPI003DA6C679
MTENDQIGKSIYDSLEQIRGKLEPTRFRDIFFPLFFLLFASKKFELAEKKEIETKEKLAGVSSYILQEALNSDTFNRQGILYIPKKARWEQIVEADKTGSLFSAISSAFSMIYNENDKNKFNNFEFLFKEINQSNVSASNLSLIVNLFNKKIWIDNKDNITLENIDDHFGKIYEYLIYHYGDKTNDNAGEFYTPSSIIDLLVNFLDIQPQKKIYDPCCGSGGMFIRSLNYINKVYKDDLEKKKRALNPSEFLEFVPAEFYGQEINQNTISICWSGLIINGIIPKLGNDDTFKNYFHQDQVGQIDYVLANPPFNLTLNEKEYPSWGSDPRWIFLVPSTKNANLAWIQHIYYYLRKDGGKAAVILSKDSASSPDSIDIETRRKIIESGCIQAMLFLPENLFFNTGISVCVWFLKRDVNKTNDKILILSYPEGGESESKKISYLTPSEIKNLKEIYFKYLNGQLEKEGSSVIYKQYKCEWKILTIEEVLTDNPDCSLTPGTFNIEENIDLSEDLEVDEIPFEPGNEENVLLKEIKEMQPWLKELSESKKNFDDFLI